MYSHHKRIPSPWCCNLAISRVRATKGLYLTLVLSTFRFGALQLSLLAIVGVETVLSHQECANGHVKHDSHHRNTSFLVCCNLPSAWQRSGDQSGKRTLVVTGTKTFGLVIVASRAEIEPGIALITTFTLVIRVVTSKTRVTRTIIVPSTFDLSAVIFPTVGPDLKGGVGVDSFKFVSSHQARR